MPLLPPPLLLHLRHIPLIRSFTIIFRTLLLLHLPKRLHSLLERDPLPLRRQIPPQLLTRFVCRQRHLAHVHHFFPHFLHHLLPLGFGAGETRVGNAVTDSFGHVENGEGFGGFFEEVVFLQFDAGAFGEMFEEDLGMGQLPQ